MLSRKGVILPIVPVFLLLAFLLACGGSPVKATPPPNGGFSNSSLKGTYVFSLTGSDSLGNFLAIAGTFTANGTGGSGGITGGTLDINDSGFTAPVMNNPITGGTYLITQDGRGQATLTTATPFGSSIEVDFVLTSSQHGLITEFDRNGTGSGSLDLQSAASQPAAGTYVFGLSGVSGVNVGTGGLIPVATAGAITLDASGGGTGSLDYNNNAAESVLAINSGSTVMVGGTPGKATLVTSGGTFNFDIYAVDATHLKFIETDSFPILAGDLFSQTSSTLPSGQLVFTMAGFDYGAAAPLAVGGLMTSNGTSTISNGEEDFNDSGTSDTTPQSFSGTITSSGGRYVLQLNTFENGASGAIGTFTFAAYPSSGGIELVEVDGNGVSAGVAFVQSSTSLASGQGYGLNLSAANISGISGGFEEDDIAEFVTNGGAFSGIVDLNDQGQPSFNQRLHGNYTLDSPATGRGVMTSNLFNGAFYVVSGSDVLFLETDSTQLGAGAFQVQNAGAKSTLTASHLAMLRLKPGAKGASRRR
jgi:hypothetical protein